MPDRLSELLQQRRLIEEHLAWLNREIEAAKPATRESSLPHLLSAPINALGGTPGTPQPAPPPFPLSATPAAASLENALREPDTILAEYQVDPKSLHVDVKRGCLMYFAGAMAVLILGVSLLYFMTVRRRAAASPPPTSQPTEHR